MELPQPYVRVLNQNPLDRAPGVFVARCVSPVAYGISTLSTTMMTPLL